MDYYWWNETLARHFFRPEFAGRPVFLYITDELLDGIGRAEKVGRDDFLASVRAGPPGASEDGHCLRALGVARNWRKKGFGWPPYLAYLATFSLAAGIEGDFPPHAYYNRLRTLLEEPPGYTLPNFERMHVLWRDLEEWSNKDRGGNVGVFIVRTVGKWAHVGIPKAQSLLTEYERRRLPEVFADAELDPRSPPTDGHLSHCLLRHGHDRLRARTLKLVVGGVGIDAEKRATLLEILADELRRWDGSTPQVEISEAEPSMSEAERQALETLRKAQREGLDEHEPGRVTGYMRICCEFDRVRRFAATFMRCTFSGEFPEGEFRLGEDRTQSSYKCEEELPGWSSYLAHADTGQPIPASTFDWARGKKLIVEGLGWIVKLPPSDVRIFVDGSPSGMHGLVEQRRLPRVDQFYIASNRNCADEILSWARKSCENLTEFGELDGFPEGWNFFGARGVLDDSLVRGKFPILSLPSGTRLFFDGGMKSASGNTFFWFCAPRIALETDDPSIRLYCNGVPAARSEVEDIYNLPPIGPGKVTVIVEAKRGDEVVVSRFLYLEEANRVLPPDESIAFRADGRPLLDLSASEPWFSGARAGPGGTPFDFAQAAVPRVEARRVFAIGKLVGQIEKLSRGSRPKNWTPIWQIALERKGVAYYCGSDVEADRPVLEGTGDRKREKLWKEVLWYSRKVIAPPIHPALRRLWLEYQEVARDA